MNAVIDHPAPNQTIDAMNDVLARQKAAFAAELPVSLATRRDRLDKAIALLVDHQDALCEAMDEDFGQRPVLMSKFVDIAASIIELKHARKAVKRWMKPKRESVRFPLGLLGASARIEYQPKGVVGIIAPWNFPVGMVFEPMAGALAAGNRLMIKPSEFTPKTSALMAKLISEYFDDDEIWVVNGGADIGKAFSELPFDHLFFTGSTGVGRHIMRAAAENLTPVTLELGGKSPAIVSESADLSQVISRLVIGKQMNSGQVCLAPDYAFVPQDSLNTFISQLSEQAEQYFPDMANHSDVTAIVSQRHYDRFKKLLAEARAAGHQVIGAEANDDKRVLPLTLVINPSDDLALMQEEIFGPILPVKTYQTIDEVINYINTNSRPLGLYYFGSNDAERRQILDRTIAGGVTLDDVIYHFSVAELPFGGIGGSGIGNYHGIHGFRTFSHSKAVYQQAKIDVAKMLGFIPPYGKKLERMLKLDIRK